MDQFKSYKAGLVFLALFSALYPLSVNNYLLFHSLAEFFSITITAAIFILVWNARFYLHNNYLLLLGIASLFIAGIDILHTLSYQGMGVFQGYDAGLAPQLWIAGRFLQAITLVLAPLFLGRLLNTTALFGCYAAVVGLLLATILVWQVFPVCFIEGQGLTPFKRFSEYIICLILAGAFVLLKRHKQHFDKQVLNLMLASIVATIISELAFTFYVQMYGFSNLFGHYAKILAAYLLYKAVIETGLMKPYNLLLRTMKLKEEDLLFAQHAFKQLSDAAFWIDQEGRIKYTNTAASQMLGYDQQELLTLHLHDLQAGATPSLWQEQWQTLKKQGSMTTENILLSKDSRQIPVESSASFVSLGNRELICHINRDTSQRKQIESALLLNMEKLENFNKSILGREMRNIELKREINSLCAELNRPPLYPVVDKEGEVGL